MTENTYRTEINQVLMPAYYKDFQCIGGKCLDSCCKYHWNIIFSKKDYLKIKQAKKSPALAEKVRQSMQRLRGEEATDASYAEFGMKTGACGLLSADGLCTLQMECGYDCLPRVCKIFPRRETRTVCQKMQSLSTGCEAVLQLLYDLPDGVEFILEPLPPKAQMTLNIEKPSPWQARYPEILSVCIDILQARAFPLPQRMILLGLALKDLQASESELENWLARSAAMLKNPDISALLVDMRSNRNVFLLDHIKFLLRVKAQSEVWQQIIDALQVEVDYAIDERGMAANIKGKAYIDLYAQYEQAFAEKFGDLEYFFENIMVAQLFHYQYPDTASAEAIWKSYVNLCNMYSSFRFCAIAGTAVKPDFAQLFHVLVTLSRTLIHNQVRQAHLRDELFQNDSSTLAHMAILVLG